MTSIAVAVVNYNTRDHLRTCLSSVFAERPTEVVVVDNASLDGSVEMVQAEFPSATLRVNKTNIGYGAAANQAIATVKSAYVLLLNADTRLQPGALEALSAYLDQHPRAAIVGPRLAESDGTLQASCYPFPTPLDTFLENCKAAIIVGRTVRRYCPTVGRFYLRTWPHNFARTVSWVKGAVLTIRREAFDAIGGFDPSYFMYFEDADLCYRLTASGWEIHFTPVTTAVHSGGASTRQRHAVMSLQLLTSTVRFYQRHCSTFQLAIMIVVLRWLMLSRWAGAATRLVFTRDPGKRSLLAQEISTSQQFSRWASPLRFWRATFYSRHRTL